MYPHFIPLLLIDFLAFIFLFYHRDTHRAFLFGVILILFNLTLNFTAVHINELLSLYISLPWELESFYGESAGIISAALASSVALLIPPFLAIYSMSTIKDDRLLSYVVGKYHTTKYIKTILICLVLFSLSQSFIFGIFILIIISLDVFHLYKFYIELRFSTIKIKVFYLEELMKEFNNVKKNLTQDVKRVISDKRPSKYQRLSTSSIPGNLMQLSPKLGYGLNSFYKSFNAIKVHKKNLKKFCKKLNIMLLELRDKPGEAYMEISTAERRCYLSLLIHSPNEISERIKQFEQTLRREFENCFIEIELKNDFDIFDYIGSLYHSILQKSKDNYRGFIEEVSILKNIIDHPYLGEYPDILRSTLNTIRSIHNQGNGMEDSTQKKRYMKCGQIYF